MVRGQVGKTAWRERGASTACAARAVSRMQRGARARVVSVFCVTGGSFEESSNGMAAEEVIRSMEEGSRRERRRRLRRLQKISSRSSWCWRRLGVYATAGYGGTNRQREMQRENLRSKPPYVPRVQPLCYHSFYTAANPGAVMFRRDIHTRARIESVLRGKWR